MLHYVDDAFNVSFPCTLSFYQPYARLMPADQANFLRLLDLVGITHEDHKQQFGETLEIIGFVVDLHDMTNSAYHKVAGHTFMNAPVYLNKQICTNLL